ncbi:MAG: glycosyltransferase family 2 protein, partial [Bdellovibrionales bacterium]|nr:glycosyltransferase family 2 protein [Bdellovibrionales bacterium]
MIREQASSTVEDRPAAGASREPISGIVVAFNEEKHIGDCLDSLAFCDEVLVVDSFSTDRTVEIARGRGATVIQREWPGYRAQKAFALQQAQHEWIINIDADERVSPELRENVLRVLEGRCDELNGGEEVVGFQVNRLVFYLGRWWRQGGWYPEYRLRFFKRSRVSWGGEEPHEKVIPHGRTSKLDGDIYHFTYNDMADQIDRLNHFSSAAATALFEREAKLKLRHLLLNPWIRFFKFYILKRGYREGLAGFIVAVLEGFYTFIKYAKLWESYFNQRKTNELDGKRAA